ncbi:sensor histidine kinase [Natronorubrum texcoconense]|uniref:histidine kinase n=1 Tax=Natronorubrum texcoconense TaxID=1095776 RepID=A0A1G9BHI4_9EURY|nr:ATP-binding protein [Natronorubrum texcoconense]SDK38952.1 His Kinase A (phospho-acceptor) domain-containing protein [Natronorubrum texcoconense]
MLSRSHFISVLGVLFIVIAVGQSFFEISRGNPLSETGIDFVLISLPGILLLYVGRWLSTIDVDRALYLRIAGWCLGGIGVMLVFLFLRAIHPGVATSFTFGERAIAIALGSVAGLTIGIHDARAIIREHEAKRRNDQLERARAELDRRNDELRAVRDELEEKVDEVERSNERLDHFASIASHDLREPLRMISSYLDLLEDRHADDLDSDGEEFLEYAIDGAERMTAMIDGLLAYSRIETQGDPFEPVDLNAVLADVRDDLQLRIDEYDAEITTESLPRVRGDATQLRQLFQNLLSNALEYSGDDPPRVNVTAVERDSEWIISVRDEGVGIGPDDQERIFELFQRLHTVDESAGSGIGLAFCRRIVDRHGGTIRVDSEPGEGSTFSVTFLKV